MTIYDGISVKPFSAVSSDLTNLHAFLERFGYKLSFGPMNSYVTGEHRWEYSVLVKTKDVQTSDGRGLSGYFTFNFDSVNGMFDSGGRVQKEYKKEIEIIKKYVYLCCLSFGGIK